MMCGAMIPMIALDVGSGVGVRSASAIATSIRVMSAI
jgi:hypothetical protein